MTMLYKVFFVLFPQNFPTNPLSGKYPIRPIFLEKGNLLGNNIVILQPSCRSYEIDCICVHVFSHNYRSLVMLPIAFDGGSHGPERFFVDFKVGFGLPMVFGGRASHFDELVFLSFIFSA